MLFHEQTQRLGEMIRVKGTSVHLQAEGYFRGLMLRGISKQWYQFSPAQKRRARIFFLKLSLHAIEQKGFTPTFRPSKKEGTVSVIQYLGLANKEFNNRLRKLNRLRSKYKSNKRALTALKKKRDRLQNLIDVAEAILFEFREGKFPHAREHMEVEGLVDPLTE